MKGINKIFLVGLPALLALLSGYGRIDASKTEEKQTQTASVSASAHIAELIGFDSTSFYYNTGLTDLEKRRIPDAISNLEKAVKLYEKKGGDDLEKLRAYASLGTAYYYGGKYTGAIRSFERTLQLNKSGNYHLDTKPEEEMYILRIWLAESYYRTGNFEKSFNTLYQANLFYPKNPDILRNYSLVAQEFKKDLESTIANLDSVYTDLKSTITDLESRIGADPETSKDKLQSKLEQAHSALGQTRYKLVETHYKLGDLYIKAGEFQKAKEEAKDILLLNPESLDTQRLLGRVAFEQYDFKTAIGHYCIVLQHDKHCESSYFYLGASFNNIKKFNLAIQFLQKGLNYFPKSAGIHYMLGVAYDNIGRTDDATYHFHQASVLRPELPKYRNPRRKKKEN